MNNVTSFASDISTTTEAILWLQGINADYGVSIDWDVDAPFKGAYSHDQGKILVSSLVKTEEERVEVLLHETIHMLQKHEGLFYAYLSEDGSEIYLATANIFLPMSDWEEIKQLYSRKEGYDWLVEVGAFFLQRELHWFREWYEEFSDCITV